MKNIRIKIAVYGLSAVFFIIASACSKKEQNIPFADTTERAFSIAIEKFDSFYEAEKFIQANSYLFKDSLRIRQTAENEWKIFTGRFSSSYLAGKYAFGLYSDSIIQNFNITYRRNKIFDNYANILFVGMDMGRPSIYNFNLISRKYELLWSRWGRKVINLNHARYLSKAFITTALGMGWRGSLPYVLDASVYFFDGSENEANKILDLGKGLQVYTYWETPDTFKINYSYLDTIKTSVIYQRIISFDPLGRALKEWGREFEILRDGFPLPPLNKPDYYSPNGQFHIKEIKNGADYLFDLENSADKSVTNIAITHNKIFDVKWTDDSKFAFIITENTVRENSNKNQLPAGELYIISSLSKKAIKSFGGFKYKNFVIHGDLLIFDEKTDNDSHIIIYNFVKNGIYYTLRIPGGCGLNNISL